MKDIPNVMFFCRFLRRISCHFVGYSAVDKKDTVIADGKIAHYVYPSNLVFCCWIK